MTSRLAVPGLVTVLVTIQPLGLSALQQSPHPVLRGTVLKEDTPRTSRPLKGKESCDQSPPFGWPAKVTPIPRSI